MPTYQIPPDTRAVGTPDPANDMNNAADMLGLITSLLAQLAGAGTSLDPAGNTANVNAIAALRTAASLAPGAAGTVLTSAGTGAAPAFATLTLPSQSVSATATLTAASAPAVLTDTTTTAFTLTLPAAPATGEFFLIIDRTGQWNTHNLTIGRNGKNIDGAAAGLTLSNQWGKVWLYYDGTAWWTVANGLSNETPAALGTAGPGVRNSAARTDHAHPVTGLVTGVTAADTSVVVGGTASAPTVATGTLDVIATQHPAAAAVPVNGKTLTNAGAAGVTLPWLAGLFGDGSDGAIVLDGTTAFNNFSSLAGSTYTLTRDVYATNFTVNNAVTLKPAGFRVFCAGTFTDNTGSTVDVHGGNGTAAGAAGSAGGAQGTVGNGKTGGAGQTTAGSAGGSVNSAGYGTAGAGGTGASGAGGGGGTAGGTGNTWYKSPGPALNGALSVAGTTTALNGAPSGGGGGGDNTNKGGGGGGGGGVIVIFAWAIVHNGTWNASGGGGGTPATGNCGGGGAGSGGLILTYSLTAPTGAGTSNVAAGTAGSGAGTGTAGGAGGAGTVLNQVLA